MCWKSWCGTALRCQRKYRLADSDVLFPIEFANATDTQRYRRLVFQPQPHPVQRHRFAGAADVLRKQVLPYVAVVFRL